MYQMKRINHVCDKTQVHILVTGARGRVRVIRLDRRFIEGTSEGSSILEKGGGRTNNIVFNIFCRAKRDKLF